MKARFWSYTYQFIRPAGTSRGILHQKPGYFLEVEALGFRGQGECGLLPGLSIDDRPDYVDALEQLCAQIQSLDRAQWSAWAKEGIPAALYTEWEAWPSLVFALEQALWSWAADQAGRVAKQLFDSPFCRGEAGIPINGLLWMGDHCYQSEQMEQHLNSGFECLKMKVGAMDFAQECALLSDMRALGPAELELRVDANGAWTADVALERMKSLALYRLHSIEQPCPAHDREGLAMLARKGAVPIALDESLIGVHSADERDRLLDEVQPQYIVLKPSLLGGAKSCEDWILRAEKRDISWWITSALEGSVGLSAIAQWASGLENLQGYQGFGTGSLYQNNLPSSTEVRSGALWMR
ncbi:MAG: o-succinylbenzoate synthase [Schleiferiaceae bacterium]|nr:o-succinylbenzoate synthase [Schleiferiaceae bacterium]